MAAGSGPTDQACVVHHRTDELLLEEHAFSDGQATALVKDGNKHAQFLRRLSSYLVVVCRPGEPNMKGYAEISYRFESRSWLSYKLNWPGFSNASLCEEHRPALRDVDRNPPIPRSTWRDGVGMSFTYELNGSGETIPPWTTPARML